MTLKGTGKGPLPPLLQQYVELRESYPDYLMLFQVGDFYETFGEDAERLARALGIILTHKSSKDFVTPMAGVPLRSADGYIERLLSQGFRVAVADQVEDKGEAEGLVRREISQLITPGTVTDEGLLKPDANYLAAVAAEDGYGLALLDVSTGEFRGTQLYSKSALFDELARYKPAEVLLAPELYDFEASLESFRRRFAVMPARGRFGGEAAELLARQLGAGLPELAPAVAAAAGAVLSYAQETQQGALPQVRRFSLYDPGSFMQVGEVAFAALEIFGSTLGSATLLGALDCTRTAPGRRLLKAWLRHPLLDAALIEARLDAVEAFTLDGVFRDEVRKTLYKIHDLERLAARLAAGRASPRDLAALERSLALLPELRAHLGGRSEAALGALLERMQELDEAGERIRAALVAEPPGKKEGRLIRDGFDSALDGLRQQAEAGREWIGALEKSERARTGVPTLKVGFNHVFGYFLEITRAHYALIPGDYRAVQTLKDRQRFTRDDLQGKEREILRAEEAAKRREAEVFAELRAQLAPFAERVSELSAVLAELDVYAALAQVAATRGYSRPRLSKSGRLRIRQGRHPVVEAHQLFIPNDLELSAEARLVILTGPNMSGKSTYLRQTALIALLAQVGSFVPAAEAELPLFDRVYTRIGAGDDIAGGRSTFMVEMEELAAILRTATPQSLVLLDEIGRGTSTYDGLSLAWAASEYLHDQVGAYTLFASHYFELTGLADTLPAARNHHVAAKEEAGGLVFYHQVLPGPASKAYGLEVAKLAGLPAPALARARAVLAGLEARGDAASAEVLEALLEADLSRLSPLEALTFLHRLQARARGLVLDG